jgi:beta-N-acetylhexosaminidase
MLMPPMPGSEPERIAAVEPPPEPAPLPTEPALPPEAAPSPPAPVASEVQLAQRVDALLAPMSFEQKIGQLMMVGFGGTAVNDDIAGLVKGRRVGGVCLFKRNIVSAQQVAKLNDEVRALMADTIPPFIAVDQEGGNVVRISEGAVVLPGNMALGATGSTQLAYEAGRAQGEGLKLLGFNMNLAPVLDVNVNPRNPVIGIRSFGDRPDRVAQFGVDFIRGQQDAQIVTVAKHFPGHGSVDADSHRALPVMRESEAEVMRQLEPFSRAIQGGLDGLMTAHVAVPSLTHSSLPATLSPQILTGLLRQKLGFDGLVLTDELEMEAIAKSYGVGPAAVSAIKAGADMVLIPWTPEKKLEVYQALLASGRSGDISAARLDDAVRHILTAKVKRGLFAAPAPLATRMEEVAHRDHHAVADQVSRESVTLLRTDGRTFPLKPGQGLLVVTPEPALAQAIVRRDKTARVLVVPGYPGLQARADLRQRVRELALESKVVVVGVLNSRQLELVTMAAAADRPVVVVTLGLPYLAEQATEARAVLALYTYRASSAEAAAASLFGEQGTPGRLPVSLPHYPFGHGLDPVGQATAKKAARP